MALTISALLNESAPELQGPVVTLGLRVSKLPLEVAHEAHWGYGHKEALRAGASGGAQQVTPRLPDFLFHLKIFTHLGVPFPLIYVWNPFEQLHKMSGSRAMLPSCHHPLISH